MEQYKSLDLEIDPILILMNFPETAEETYNVLNTADLIKHPDDTALDIIWSNRQPYKTKHLNAIDIIYSRWEEQCAEEGIDVYAFLIDNDE